MDLNPRLLARYGVAMTATIILSGCAVTSVFNPYPNQALQFKSALNSPDPQSSAIHESVLVELAEERESSDAMLYMMERGRITQLLSLYEESKGDFQLVIDKFEQQDLAATVETSSMAAQGASMLTNDNAIPYSGSGYERIFTHHFQAFNYWGLGNVEGASIEFRKAALEQQVLLQKYESEIAEAHEEAEEEQIDVDTLSAEFSGLDTVAGKVKSSFQNAYTFYTSAAFWEATGELNNALVDYKKALEINPSAELIKQDIARVSKQYGTSTNFKELNLPGENQGTVVLFYEEGFVPAKSETKLSLPTLDGGIISIAFPTYETENWPRAGTLRIRDDGFNDLGTTQQVADVGAMAVKSLKEQIPAMIVRQALRAYSKYELQKQSGEQFGLMGSFAANIYNIISESADRRSWLTLPNSAQVLRFNLDQGQRLLSLASGALQQELPLNIEAGKTTFVRVVNVNNQLIPQVFKL